MPAGRGVGVRTRPAASGRQPYESDFESAVAYGALAGSSKTVEKVASEGRRGRGAVKRTAWGGRPDKGAAEEMVEEAPGMITARGR
jgi:hypothetical protein